MTSTDRQSRGKERALRTQTGRALIGTTVALLLAAEEEMGGEDEEVDVSEGVRGAVDAMLLLAEEDEDEGRIKVVEGVVSDELLADALLFVFFVMSLMDVREDRV